ncbi:unnamed protein product [Prorocentrum cordatum]|uniref:Beta-galactosidase n=1 Tax=Prorocentrum cordatum TaxID=2364126 RepID=A0ABN9TBS1_9DINO|nr:unnamed protein product [Polarella glacialis]
MLTVAQMSPLASPVLSGTALFGCSIRCRRRARPVYDGDYPACMRCACGDRLPTFTDEERELLKGSSDFFGLNSYSSNMASPGRPRGPGYWEDIGVEWWHVDRGWERTDMGWPVVPWGFRELLLYIQVTSPRMRCEFRVHPIPLTEGLAHV